MISSDDVLVVLVLRLSNNLYMLLLCAQTFIGRTELYAALFCVYGYGAFEQKFRFWVAYYWAAAVRILVPGCGVVSSKPGASFWSQRGSATRVFFGGSG